ncbi:MAG TPA: hypothetical protein VJ732_08500 [Bryobacteraceae bacterium]|nr:hypothetical protein [Bryobacteraceae bacterium]
MTSKPEWGKPQPERLPHPNFAPPVLAVGMMCVLWGAVTSWLVTAAGLVLCGTAISLWMRDLRQGR